MIWIVLISSIAVATTYVGIFLQTRDTWTAVIAASIVSAIAAIIMLIHATKPPVTRKTRIWAFTIALIMILGTGGHMRASYQQTHWQYGLLHEIHKVIFHGVALAVLQEHGIETLAAFHQQSGSGRMTLGKLFMKKAHFADPDSLRIELSSDYQAKLFAASVTDTAVMLVVQSSIRIDGEDHTFKNYDGQIGAVQDRMIITRKGLVYELQN